MSILDSLDTRIRIVYETPSTPSPSARKFSSRAGTNAARLYHYSSGHAADLPFDVTFSSCIRTTFLDRQHPCKPCPESSRTNRIMILA